MQACNSVMNAGLLVTQNLIMLCVSRGNHEEVGQHFPHMHREANSQAKNNQESMFQHHAKEQGRSCKCEDQGRYGTNKVWDSGCCIHIEDSMDLTVQSAR